MNIEQQIIDAFERGKAFGFAEGMRSKQAEIEQLKKEKDRITQDLIGASFYEHDYKTLLPEYEALKEQLEDCTCQGGHSEAYLIAKGKK